MTLAGPAYKRDSGPVGYAVTVAEQGLCGGDLLSTTTTTITTKVCPVATAATVGCGEQWVLRGSPVVKLRYAAAPGEV